MLFIGKPTGRSWMIASAISLRRGWVFLEQGCGKQTPSARKQFFQVVNWIQLENLRSFEKYPTPPETRDLTSHNSREYFREWLRESLRSCNSHSFPLPIVTPLRWYRSTLFDSNLRFFSRQRVFFPRTLRSSLTPRFHVGRCGEESVAGEHVGPDGNGISRGGPSWDGWSSGSERRFAAAASFCSRCPASERSINKYMTYCIYMTYVYMYIYTHTHTYIHLHMYIYII